MNHIPVFCQVRTTILVTSSITNTARSKSNRNIMSAVMVPIKQEIVSAGVEVKVEEHSIEMDCQTSVKQEINSTNIQDVEMKLEE